MNGFVTNIEQASLENTNFRKVLYTTDRLQLVLMSLKSGEEIGEEIHELDQFIHVGKAKATEAAENFKARWEEMRGKALRAAEEARDELELED